MSINFLDPVCQEPLIDAEIFGLCDDQDGQKAYTDVIDESKWIAKVINNNKISILFIAVDKCVMQDNDYPNRGRCDAILTTQNHLYFIELKDELKGWISGAIDQLESTIRFFQENHDINIYRHKKAFACNKRRSKFQEIDNELNLRFFREYKVRIDVQGDVLLV